MQHVRQRQRFGFTDTRHLLTYHPLASRWSLDSHSSDAVLCKSPQRIHWFAKIATLLWGNKQVCHRAFHPLSFANGIISHSVPNSLQPVRRRLTLSSTKFILLTSIAACMLRANVCTWANCHRRGWFPAPQPVRQRIPCNFTNDFVRSFTITCGLQIVRYRERLDAFPHKPQHLFDPESTASSPNQLC